MWASRLRITGIDPVHARNLWSLLTLERSTTRPQPMAFVILDRGRPVHVIAGKRSTPPPAGFDRLDAACAAPFAAVLGVRLLLAIEDRALRELVDSIDAGLRHGDDHFSQAGFALDRMREAIRAGDLVLWPDFFEVLLKLDEATMRRFMDAVFPPRTSVLMYVFRKQAIHSAIILVRGDSEIESVTGHWSIRDDLKTYSPWQDGYARILEASSKVHAQPSLAFFGELEAVEGLLHTPRPGLLTREIVDRRIIIDPMPPWMTAALGVDAVTRAAHLGMGLLDRMDFLGLGRRFDLGGIRQDVKTRVDAGIDLTAMLGFNPFDFLTQFASWWSGR